MTANSTETLEEKVKAIIELYADSYRRMATMGDGKVGSTSVEYDLTYNISPQLAEAVRRHTLAT